MSGLRVFCLSVVGVGLLSACGSKAPPQTDQPSAAAAPASPAAPSAAPQSTTPESGLAIKRGTASVAQGKYSFQPCGGGPRWTLQGEAVEVLKSFSAAATPELFLEARGEYTQAAAGAGDLVIQELLYVAPLGGHAGCNSPAPDYKVWAGGGEPFWSMKVRNGTMSFAQAADATPREFTLADAADTEGAVIYRATSADGHKLELAVAQQACRESKSGEYFGFSAQATLDEQHFTGCARPGE